MSELWLQSGIRPERQAREQPESVVATDEFLNGLGVWHVISENYRGQEAGSCKDAAPKRMRVGDAGIPPWDEMKTLVGRSGKSESIVMVHIRGDREVDEENLASVLDGAFQPLEEEELAVLGMGYGLVNPFHDKLGGHDVTHVFDEDLLRPLGTLGTVMTNAGDTRWGVGFKAHELRNRLPRSRSAEISRIDPKVEAKRKWTQAPPKFGIITGNPSTSGDFLKNLTNIIIAKRLGRHAVGDVVLPTWIIVSDPVMGETMRISDYAADVLVSSRAYAEGLCELGANVVTIACNTTPTREIKDGVREITDAYEAELVLLPEVVGSYLRQNDSIRRLHLLAAGPVAGLDERSAYTDQLEGLEEIIGPTEDGTEEIDDIAYKFKQPNLPWHPQLNRLRNIINACPNNAAILVALAEASMLLNHMKPGERSRLTERFTIIDSMQLCAYALANRYVPEPLAKSV